MQSINVQVEKTKTGWVAYRPGIVLAARGSTKEDAVTRYEAARALVGELAAKSRAATSDPSEPKPPFAQSLTAAQD